MVIFQRALIIDTGAGLIIAAFAAQERDRALAAHCDRAIGKQTEAVTDGFAALHFQIAVAAERNVLILIPDRNTGAVRVELAPAGEIDGIFADQDEVDRAVRMDASPDARLI